MLKNLRLFIKEYMETFWIALGVLAVSSAFAVFSLSVPKDATNVGLLRFGALVCLFLGVLFFVFAAREIKRKEGKEEDQKRAEKERTQLEIEKLKKDNSPMR